MNRARSIALESTIGLVTVMTLVLWALNSPAGAEDGHLKHSGKARSTKEAKAVVLSLEKIHSGRLPMVLQSIDKALEAIELGDKTKALAELNKVSRLITEINEAIGKHIVPKFVNVRCPIMGGTIKPDNTTKNLIRTHKGDKIAFCCAGCPAAWDKLADNEKEAKLAKVRRKYEQVWTCSMHPEIRLPKGGACPICNMNLVRLSEGHSKD